MVQTNNQGVKIGENAFLGMLGLTSIKIPKDVKKINASAFERCRNVSELKYNAENCDDLSDRNWVFAHLGANQSEGVTVTIGSDVVKIPSWLFCPYGEYNQPKITSLKWETPSKCQTLGASAFAHADYLTTITIPETITNIGYATFQDCHNTTTVNYNATNCLDPIENNYVFFNLGSNATGVTVNIGSNVKNIPGYLFYPYDFAFNVGQPKITAVVWKYDSQCEKIGEYAFTNCTTLTSIDLPLALKTVGYCAFYKCSGLTSITIPSSVTNIEDRAFRECHNVTTVNYNATNCADLAAYNLVFYELGISGTGVTVNIGANVKKIPAKLFLPDQQYGTKPKITAINWAANSVCEEIGVDAFAYCSEFSSITLPTSLKKISNWAFHCCSGLASITIPAGVTSIGNGAFDACTSLTSITVLNPTPPSLGSGVFNGISNFTIYVPSSSVNAYKAATNWSEYSSRIQAIT